jgi:hypothetical protein
MISGVAQIPVRGLIVFNPPKGFQNAYGVAPPGIKAVKKSPFLNVLVYLLDIQVLNRYIIKKFLSPKCIQPEKLKNSYQLNMFSS